MDTQIINIVSNVLLIINSILCIIFCLLALFVLVYYVRRRYKLYKERNRIPRELLIMESYRNHLKNLKIKCIINNLIIIILIVEFIENFGQIFINFSYLIMTLIKGHSFRSLEEFENYTFLFTIPIYYSFIPILSMMMDFLWLAYRKYEYKYTIIRWTWYILIRALVAFLLQYFQNTYSLFNIFYSIFPIIDFIQFVYYARKFYLHLKSREKEIKLFYFDKKAYLDSKYLRIHFKIATILVVSAIFFFALSSVANLLIIFTDIPDYIPIPQQLNDKISIVYSF